MKSKFVQLVLFVGLATAVGAASCMSSQYQDANNLCQPCPDSCITCSGPSFCNTCISNSYAYSNSSGTFCVVCPLIQEGCLICLSSVSCQTCSVGYILRDSVCVTCSTSISNCARCSSDGNFCSQCKYPYILFQNSCISQTINQIVEGGNINPIPPKPANNTNTTTNSTTPINPVNLTLPNGTVVTLNYDQYGCNQFQVFAYRKCLRLIPQCQVYLLTGLCQVCYPNFIVNIYGSCSPNNTILNC